MALTYVDDVSTITPEKVEWTMNVKIIRLWITHTLQRPTSVNSMEMVCMDAKGFKIHASVRQDLMFKFQHLISENQDYSISTFEVVPNDGPFKTTHHDFKINFNLNTEIAPLPHARITLSPFSFVPFARIMSKEQDPDYFVDVIGILTVVGSVIEWHRDNIKKQRIQIELESDGQRLECVLLGDYVDELTNFVSKGDAANSVVVIQFAKMRVLHGVQSVTGPTKLIFNPDIVESEIVEQRFLENSEDICKVLRQLQDPSKISIREDFLSLSSIKTIDQIRVMKDECTCVTLGTIKYFAPPCDWWYPAVKSKKCGECNGRVNSITPKYHISVRVADKTGIATFIICDDDATKFLKKSCADLIEGHYEGARNTIMPEEICGFIGKTFLFKIRVNNSDCKNFEPTYHVTKLCWDSEIINQFKMMYPKFVDSENDTDKASFLPVKSIYDVHGDSSNKASSHANKNEPATFGIDSKDIGPLMVADKVHFDSNFVEPSMTDSNM